jgi:hypothetical protein
MEIVGGGKVHVYEAVDEGPHASGPQELWQESVVLLWWDLKQGIGGFYRIGHETNHATGPMIALWSSTFSPQGHYKKTTYLPLREEDRLPNGFGSGEGTVRYTFDGQCVWTIEDEDISATLRVHDFHSSIDCYPKKGQLSEFAPHHMEVAGRVMGPLKIKGVEYQVDALCFRDHGWGERAWHTLLSHRWLAGVFGPQLSFCAISWHSIDDVLVQFGWIVRDDRIIYAKHLDIVAYVECDAMTTRGGHLRMTLTTGEELDIDFTPVAPSAMSFVHGIACVDTLSRITCGDKVGIANFETTHNGQGGKRKPAKLSRGFIENGWHSAASVAAAK